MDTLSLHIEYLLTRHDCVIVPGIGAFIATEKEASIDFAKGVISPCQRLISFNAGVSSDDGLLAHSIARREHISYEQAHQRLVVFASKMRSDLRSEGEFSIGMVGRLLMDEEGLISFQPRLSRIQADITPTLSIQNAATNPDSSRENLRPRDMRHAREIKSSSDYYVIRLNKRAVHAAAMLITILTVGLSLLIPINHDNTQKASVVPIPDIIYVPDSGETHCDTIRDEIPGQTCPAVTEVTEN